MLSLLWLSGPPRLPGKQGAGDAKRTLTLTPCGPGLPLAPGMPGGPARPRAPVMPAMPSGPGAPCGQTRELSVLQVSVLPE